MDRLAREYPATRIALNFETPLQLLVATVLAAQCTDKKINEVTPALFRRYPAARDYAEADLSELEEMVRATGFFRNKARALKNLGQALLAAHDGEVPASMEALRKLPGVGRKTANVVLGHALGVPGLPVDRHVLRVANRIGLVKNDDPVRVEAQLCGMLPPERWTRASDALILHGRRICRPKPLCKICNVRPHCDFYRTGVLTKPINRKKAAKVITAKARKRTRA
jgi:endonuclease III